MIEAKEAVKIAKERASEFLDSVRTGLEEIELEDYKGTQVWSITLSVPCNVDLLTGFQSAASRLSLSPTVVLKRFLIDADTGQFVAMRLREAATR